MRDGRRLVVLVGSFVGLHDPAHPLLGIDRERLVGVLGLVDVVGGELRLLPGASSAAVVPQSSTAIGYSPGTA
jgi:hypothetical protein